MSTENGSELHEFRKKCCTKGRETACYSDEVKIDPVKTHPEFTEIFSICNSPSQIEIETFLFETLHVTLQDGNRSIVHPLLRFHESTFLNSNVIS
jgi:hypothetical protein